MCLNILVILVPNFDWWHYFCCTFEEIAYNRWICFRKPRGINVNAIFTVRYTDLRTLPSGILFPDDEERSCKDGLVGTTLLVQLSDLYFLKYLQTYKHSMNFTLKTKSKKYSGLQKYSPQTNNATFTSIANYVEAIFPNELLYSLLKRSN